MSRTSIVSKIRVISVAFSSVVKVGDSEWITPKSKVFAVQKRLSTFNDDEGNLEDYPIYSRPLVMPVAEHTLQDGCLVRDPNRKPIHIDSINIVGLSTSSILQIGNTSEIFAESRIKHIRDYT